MKNNMKTGSLVLGAAFASAVVAWSYNEAMLSVLAENDRKQLSATMPDGAIVSVQPTPEDGATRFNLKKGADNWQVTMTKGLPDDYFVGTPYTPPYVAQHYSASFAKACDLLQSYKTPAPKLWVSNGAQTYMANQGLAAQAAYQRECV